MNITELGKVAVYGFIGGAGIVFLSALAVMVLELKRRAIWNDDATRRGMIRAYVKYVHYNTDWLAVAYYSVRGGVVAGIVMVLLSIFLVGVVEILTASL